MKRLTHKGGRGKGIVHTAASQCLGKHPFPNGTEAHRVAREQQRKKRAEFGVYRCPHCGKFHIGGQ